MKNVSIMVLGSLLSFTVAAHEVQVKVALFPAGGFEAKTTKAKGDIKTDGKKYTAEKIWVKTEDLKSGIDLRDEHFHKYLNSEKIQKINFTDVKAEDGKGTGILDVNDVKRPVNFTYKVISPKKLEATFKVKASDFKLKEAKYMEIGVNDEVEVVAILDV